MHPIYRKHESIVYYLDSKLGDTDDEEWWGRWCGGQERWRHICGNLCAWVRSYPLTTHLLCVNVTNWLPLDQNTNDNATMVICAECRSFLRRYSWCGGPQQCCGLPPQHTLGPLLDRVGVCMYVCILVGWLISWLRCIHTYILHSVCVRVSAGYFNWHTCILTIAQTITFRVRSGA